MICSHCAAEMPDISAFCPVCGRPVGKSLASPAQGTRDALLGGLAYVTVIPAIVFLAVPAFRSSRFVRFHSWQSVFFAAAAAMAGLLVKFLFAVLSILPLIGFLAACLAVGITFIAIAATWVVLPVKALQGQNYRLPVVGGIAAAMAE
jgi:uncharacterized membrane protein